MTLQTTTSKSTMTSPFNWRVFWVLLGMVAFGLIALIPYALTIAQQEFSTAMIPQLAVQFIGQIALYAILIVVGLKLGQRIGLGSPALESWLRGESTAIDAKAIWSVILAGVGAGIAMILLDIYIFAPRLEAELLTLGEDIIRPPAWQGFLASFYGGIVEEVMMRLFLLTMLAWLGSKLSHTADGRPTTVVVWIAILVSGLIFGIGHLPAAAAMGIQLTPLYVVRTLVLNSVGVIYGWLYWRRGLESAMLAHFSTDIAVLVLGAMLLG